MLASSTSDEFKSSAQTNIDLAELKSRAYIPAKLPDDFLRINLNQNQITETQDTMLAHRLQYGNNLTRGGGGIQAQMNRPQVPLKGRLQMTFVEARLAKSYGLFTRMDPYIRINLDGKIFETQCDYNGGKNPKWNKTIMCYLPKHVNSFVLEIYDEKSFTDDEQIAVLNYTFPDELFDGVPVDEWVPLSGKLGEQKEGNIHMQLIFTPIETISQINRNPVGNLYYQPQLVQLPIVGSNTSNNNNNNNIINNLQPRQVIINENDIKAIHEMFPTFEESLIKTLLETNEGDNEKTINMLLQMSAEN